MTRSIRQWLEHLGLTQYADAFLSNHIDVELLPQITDQVLKDIGVASAGHRMRMLNSITKLPSAVDESQHPVATSRSINSERAPAFTKDAERRQLTILFCDLVGSTELSQRLDAEQYRNLVRAYQSICEAIITRYEGHVAQYLGDGLLVYFGYPRAHEDDAQRSIRAALEIVQTLPASALPNGPVSVRIGIHTGVVVVGEVGSGQSQEQLALGDTPNIAARLQSLALPDCIVISDRTHQLAAGSFE